MITYKKPITSQEVEDALSFWEKTRIHGASASMADSGGIINPILIRAFDKVFNFEHSAQEQRTITNRTKK